MVAVLLTELARLVHDITRDFGWEAHCTFRAAGHAVVMTCRLTR